MVRANHIIVRWSIDGGGQPLSPCIITTAPHRLSSSSSVEEEEDVRDKNEHNRRTDVPSDSVLRSRYKTKSFAFH